MLKKLLVIAALLAGCDRAPATGVSTSALTVGSTPSLMYPLASSPDGFEMDGIAGDQLLLFTTRTQHAAPSPAPDVLAFRRLGTAPLGSLAAPAGGWAGPTGVVALDSVRSGSATSGHVLVWDNGALPPAPAVKQVVKVAYAWDPVHGFSSSVAATYTLPLQTEPPSSGIINGFGFVADVLPLADGKFVLTDPFIGDLWVCDAGFSCALAMVDPDFAPAPSPKFTGIGRAPGGGTRPYTLDLTVGLSPGVVGLAYMAINNSVCMGRTAQPGGIWCVDKDMLEDTGVLPTAKSKTAVVSPTVGISDGGHGLAADPYHTDSPWLYWIRSYSDAAGANTNRAFRVNVTTGTVQVVAASNTLLDFGTGITVLPPPDDDCDSPETTLAIPMGQEENNGLLNADLGGADNFVAPTFITAVKLLSF